MLRSLRYATRRASGALKLLASPRGRRRWRRVAYELPAWDGRNALIASLVPRGSAVLDLGCGSQTLKNHLDAPSRYVPCDLIPRPGVIEIDLDRNVWPDVDGAFDYVVMSGVLEYLKAPSAALCRVHDFAPALITSYQDLRPDINKITRRMRHGWVNHMTLADVLGAFLDAGWGVDAQVEWDHSYVFVLRSANDRGRLAGA